MSLLADALNRENNWYVGRVLVLLNQSKMDLASVAQKTDGDGGLYGCQSNCLATGTWDGFAKIPALTAVGLLASLPLVSDHARL